MSRQAALESRACSIMVDRGLDGLKAWIRSLPESDQQLLDGWLVTEKPEPEEEKPEPTTEPSSAELEVGYYKKCPHCKAEQLVKSARCWDCDRDLRIKEAV